MNPPVAQLCSLTAPGCTTQAWACSPHYATLEPDGDGTYDITSQGRWSPSFLLWMGLLDQPLEGLGPPEFIQAAGAFAARISAAIPRPA